MDPVIGTGARGRIEVRGGFGLSSMNVLDVEPSAQDPLPGDEALADAIRRELREDAATVALVIAVDVCDGVASLRGTVDGLEDTEAAEEVASRAPGVVEVVGKPVLRASRSALVSVSEFHVQAVRQLAHGA